MTIRDLDRTDLRYDSPLIAIGGGEQVQTAPRLAVAPQDTPLLARLMLALARLLTSLLVRVEIRNIDRLPDSPYLLAANHMSYADSIILPSFLPKQPRLYLVGNRHTVWETWWKRLFVDAFGGVIPVNLQSSFDLASFRRCEKALASGGALIVFPEGDTGRVEGSMLPLKDGASVLAQRSGVPIVPVAISGTQDMWWRKKITVVIGEPFQTSGADRRAAKTMTAELGQRILQIMPEYREDPAETKRFRFLSRIM